MKYLNLKGSDLNVSILCLGTANFGATLSEPDSHKQLDTFFDYGGNLIDSARIYSDWIPGEKGRSERIIGDYLRARNNRSNWIISTKGGHGLSDHRLDLKDLDQDLHNSLKALGTDYIDLYSLHRDNYALEVEEILDQMNDYVSSGKIRFFGCSNWSTERIRRAQEYSASCAKPGFVANQPFWNIGSFTAVIGDDTMVSMDNEMMQLHLETGLTAMPYSAQAKGVFSKYQAQPDEPDVLTSQYLSQTNIELSLEINKLAEKRQLPISHVVLGYLLSHRITTIPVFSSSTLPQLRDTVDASSVRLTDEEVDLLDRANGSGFVA